MILIPDSWIPDVDFGKRSLVEEHKTIFQKSGFKIKVTLMLIGVLVGQFLAQFLIMNLLASLAFLLLFGFSYF